MQSPFPDATQGKVDCNHVSTRYAEPESVPLSQYCTVRGREEKRMRLQGWTLVFSAVLTPTAPLYYLALKRL